MEIFTTSPEVFTLSKFLGFAAIGLAQAGLVAYIAEIAYVTIANRLQRALRLILEGEVGWAARFLTLSSIERENLMARTR